MTPKDEAAKEFSKNVSSRKEFNILRANNSNSVRLVYKFFHEDGLQDLLAMIPAGGQFLQHAYAENYAAMREGVAEQIEFAAKRATFGWWQETTVKIMSSTSDPGVLASFGVMPKGSHHYPADSKLPWVADQCALVEKYDFYTVCLASNDAWSELTYSVTYPFVVAAVKAPEDSARRHCWLMKKIVTGIMKAEKIMSDTPLENPALNSIMHSIGFRYQNFSRKAMAKCIKAGFNHKDPELNLIAEKMGSGSCTTADVMEKTINNIQNVANRQGKGKKMSQHSKWFHASSSPSLKHFRQVQTTAEDYIATEQRLAGCYKKLSGPKNRSSAKLKGKSAATKNSKRVIATQLRRRVTNLFNKSRSSQDLDT